MDRMQRLITTTLWAVLVLVMVGVVVGQFWLPKRDAGRTLGNERPARLQELFPAGTFSLTDQNGQTFSSDQLRGHTWVADFIFTTCGNVCPIMSRKMAELQQMTPSRVKLVSFTVNPEFDTPPVLKEYAKTLKADESRWHFLTGSPQQMRDAAAGMKIPAPTDPSGGINHSNRFLLISPAGKVVGIYDGTSPKDVKRLAADATALALGKAS